MVQKMAVSARLLCTFAKLRELRLGVPPARSTLIYTATVPCLREAGAIAGPCRITPLFGAGIGFPRHFCEAGAGQVTQQRRWLSSDRKRGHKSAENPWLTDSEAKVVTADRPGREKRKAFVPPRAKRRHSGGSGGARGGQSKQPPTPGERRLAAAGGSHKPPVGVSSRLQVLLDEGPCPDCCPQSQSPHWARVEARFNLSHNRLRVEFADLFLPRPPTTDVHLYLPTMHFQTFSQCWPRSIL
jgi:hypothetical protein